MENIFIQNGDLIEKLQCKISFTELVENYFAPSLQIPFLSNPFGQARVFFLILLFFLFTFGAYV